MRQECLLGVVLYVRAKLVCARPLLVLYALHSTLLKYTLLKFSCHCLVGVQERLVRPKPWPKPPHAGMTSVQTLAARGEALRQSLDSSHQVSQEACRVLDQYCSQLSELEKLVQPVTLKTQALTQTRENVRQARAKAEEVLDHLDASRKVIHNCGSSMHHHGTEPYMASRLSPGFCKVLGQTCHLS